MDILTPTDLPISPGLRNRAVRFLTALSEEEVKFLAFWIDPMFLPILMRDVLRSCPQLFHSEVERDRLQSRGTAITIPGRKGKRVSEREGLLARKRFQGGSLVLKKKSWMARWREDVMGPDGRVRRIRKHRAIGTLSELPTRKLALRRLGLLLATVNAPGYRPGRVSTLAEFVGEWRIKVLAHRKPSTQKSAEVHLRRYILPELGHLRLDQLTLEAQQTFVSRLASKLKRKSLMNVAGTLSAVLNTAKSYGITSQWE